MHTHDSPAGQWPLAAVCIAAALWALLRMTPPHTTIDRNGTATLVGGYLCRESVLAEAVMLGSMAAMFAFPAAPVEVWRVTFAGIGVAFVGQLAITRLRRGGLPGWLVAASCFHLLAVAAMLYTTIGHLGHPPLPALGWLLVIIFAADAVVVAGVVLATPGRTRLASAVSPHLVMDAVMVAMLAAALTGGAAH